MGESSHSSFLSYLRLSSLSCALAIYLQSVIHCKVLLVRTVLNNIMSECYDFLGHKDNP